MFKRRWIKSRFTKVQIFLSLIDATFRLFDFGTKWTTLLTWTTIFYYSHFMTVSTQIIHPNCIYFPQRPSWMNVNWANYQLEFIINMIRKTNSHFLLILMVFMTLKMNSANFKIPIFTRNKEETTRHLTSKVVYLS